MYYFNIKDCAVKILTNRKDNAIHVNPEKSTKLKVFFRRRGEGFYSYSNVQNLQFMLRKGV